MPKGVYTRKPREPKRYPPEMVEEVRRLYESGMTQDEVATTIGSTQRVVWRLMMIHCIPRRPAIKRDQLGEKNVMWKGAIAKYAALHLRVQALRGKPHKCEVCGQDSVNKRYEWANLTGRYDDPSDYKRMCRSCHRKNDLAYLNLGAYAQRKEVMTNARKD